MTAGAYFADPQGVYWREPMFPDAVWWGDRPRQGGASGLSVAGVAIGSEVGSGAGIGVASAGAGLAVREHNRGHGVLSIGGHGVATKH